MVRQHSGAQHVFAQLCSAVKFKVGDLRNEMD